MLWRCESCTALYAPDLAACPQCGGHDYRLAPGGDPTGDVLSSAPAPAPATAGKKQRATAAADTPPSSTETTAAPALAPDAPAAG